MGDLVLVISHIVEKTIASIAYSSGDLNSPAVRVDLLRLGRIIRLLKVMRVMRLMRFAQDLRILVGCLVHSFNAFFWAVSLLFLIIYVVSIFLVQQVVNFGIENGYDSPAADGLLQWYGDLPRACLSLFQALTGGVDWNDIMLPIFDHL